MLDTFLANEGVEGINSFMPNEVLVTIGTSPALARYKDELVRGAHVRQAMMLLRQRMIKQVSDRLEHVHVEGLGQKIATIDPEIYEQMRLLYGAGCWRDKDFVHDTLEKNPHLRVRCRPLKTTLVVDGLRENGKRKAESGKRGQGCADRTDGSTSSHRLNERAAVVGAPLDSRRLEVATR